jgi:tellurite resistance-related uncharacterized protein
MGSPRCWHVSKVTFETLAVLKGTFGTLTVLKGTFGAFAARRLSCREGQVCPRRRSPCWRRPGGHLRDVGRVGISGRRPWGRRCLDGHLGDVQRLEGHLRDMGRAGPPGRRPSWSSSVPKGTFGTLTVPMGTFKTLGVPMGTFGTLTVLKGTFGACAARKLSCREGEVCREGQVAPALPCWRCPEGHLRDVERPQGHLRGVGRLRHGAWSRAGRVSERRQGVRAPGRGWRVGWGRGRRGRRSRMDFVVCLTSSRVHLSMAGGVSQPMMPTRLPLVT